jgi:hypothetical protein
VCVYVVVVVVVAAVFIDKNVMKFEESIRKLLSNKVEIKGALLPTSTTTLSAAPHGHLKIKQNSAHILKRYKQAILPIIVKRQKC